MKTLPLTNHTERFKLFRSSYGKQNDYIPTDTRDNTLGSYSTQRVRNVEKIDKVLNLIDQEIVKLNGIVDGAYQFDSKLDECFKLFKSCSDNINTMSNGVMGVVKAYEKPEPLVHMHYVLLVKDKLQKTEKISLRFRKLKIISDEFDQYKMPETNNAENPYTDFNEVHEHNDRAQLMKYQEDQHKIIEMERVVSEREQSIQQVSKTMAELHQQFVDIQIMVAMQGEQIAHIDDNIIKSLKYADDGVKELEGAKKYNEKANKTKRRVVSTLVVSGVFASLIAYTFKKLKL